ncbi:MAG: sodium:proton antiporter [Epulopiscium sp.]|nr:sodium:proton antiporter [Candidatus Epulonipiscium sp.]
MLFSLSLILIIGFVLSGIFNKLRLPGILGMLVTGIILGPFVLDLISPDILDVSKELREIALIVILVRAGLSLDIKDLKKVGRPAILMCFVPATFELIGTIIFAPILFSISYIEAAIMGAVLAAVSPAVVVPRMIKIMESGYGKKESIPQLILAGASVDDIYVIVLFTTFMRMYEGKDFSILSFATVPISIIVGLVIGIVSGFALARIFKKIHMRDTIKIFIILSVAFLFLTLESALKPYIPMSGLLAVMALGGTILKKYVVLAKRLAGKFSKIWVGAEVLLFVLVGAAVNIHFVASAGLASIILIVGALIFRISGVYISLIKTKLTTQEKFFCAIAYLPKATVQAAIGSMPLASGVPAGNTILTVAVLAILITAPIGAIGIDLTYKKLLTK